VKTPETVCSEIFREILRHGPQSPGRELLVLAHADVVERMLEAEAVTLGELKVQVGLPIRLQVESLYGVDQFDIVRA
jgi:ribonuclease G